MNHMLDIKLTLVKKCGFFVFLVILGVFFCLDAIWAQERSRRRDPEKWIGWEGWITISHTKELTQTFESKNQIGGGHYDETLKADAKLEVCCCGYGSTAPISNITLLNHYRAINGRKYFQNNSTGCDDERSRPYKVMRPGNSESREKQQSETKAQGEEGTSSVHLTLTRDGKYTLSASVKYLIEEIMEEVNTIEYVCRGEKRILKNTISPTASGQHFTLTSSPDGMMQSGDGPLGSHFLSFAYEGTINGDVLSGEKEMLSNTKFPDYLPLPVNPEMKVNNGLEKIVAKWNIKLKDGCADVIEQVKHEDAYIKAYNDFTLAGLSLGNKERYHDLVTNRVVQILRGFYPAKTEGQIEKETKEPVANITTNCRECKIDHKEDWLKQQKKICQPKVFVDFVLRHENAHVDQCNAYKNRGINPCIPFAKIEDTRKDEIKAYCAGLKVLLNWLDERSWCNFDTRPYRKLCETSSR